MTGPIKPPGSPKPPSSVDTPTEVNRSAETAEAFKGALEGPSEAAPATEVSAAVSAELRAGTLDAAGAVERLIADALASPAATQLSSAGKQALENHLRESLADDPNLAALVTDLER